MARSVRALTLLESLVTVAMVALLLAVLLPIRSNTGPGVLATRELAAAKDQLIALRSYAHDNRDRIIPSAPHWVWISSPEVRYNLFTRNPWDQSRRMYGPQSKVWTLHLMGMGYLNPHVVVLDRATRANFDARSMSPAGFYLDAATYGPATRLAAYAWHPSLGMNAVYVGGAYSFGGFRGQGASVSSPTDLVSPYGNPTPAPNPRVSGGQFYVQSFANIKFADRLIIFASARAGDVTNGGLFWNYGATIPNSGTIRPGHWAVLAPKASPYLRGGSGTGYTLSNAWNTSNTWNPAAVPGTWGLMDMRHENRAVTVKADGHAELQTLDQLRDMRQWANMANRPDWTFPTSASQIRW